GVGEGEATATSEEVEHAAGQEGHRDGQQHAQTDLGEDREAASPGEGLDQVLQDDGANNRTPYGSQAADQRHQDAVDGDVDVEGDVQVDEDVPLRIDAAGEPGEGGRQRVGRDLVEGRVDAHHRGRALVLADGDQAVP